jgi:hypothetical protein
MTSELPPRLRRIVELVYMVGGVTGARVWTWDESHVAVGIRVAPSSSPSEVLSRVEAAVAPLREPTEDWQFGILDDEISDDAPPPTP